MRRSLWVLGGCVFVLTVLLNMPAKVLLGVVSWPVGWQPEAVSGTLWTGRMERLGMVGPLRWNLRPWVGELQADVGFQQRDWRVSVSGWPWAWRAELAPGSALATPSTGYVVDGRWQGALRFAGQGGKCRSAEGNLRGEGMALLAPWMVVLGDAQVRVLCEDGLRVSADVRREGEHDFKVAYEPGSRKLEVVGEVEADAAVMPLLVQGGMLKPGDRRFERVFKTL